MAWTGAAFFGVLILVAVIAAIIVRAAGPAPSAGGDAVKAGFEPAPGTPELEVRPGAGARPQPRARDGYAWVDRERGVARIPLARAMELLVERGWPARDEPR